MSNQLTKSDREMMERIRAHYVFLAKMAQAKYIRYEGKRISMSKMLMMECTKAIEQINLHLFVEGA